MATSVAKSATTAATNVADGVVPSQLRMQNGAASVWLRSIESAIYGSFQVIQRKHEAHPARTVAGAVIKLLQLCAFALSSHAGYSWRATVRPIQLLAELTTIPGYTTWMTPIAYIGLYYAALAWVLLFVGLFMWATVSFMRKSWPVLWPLRVLAAMGTSSATVLFIPLLYLLMSGFSCHLSHENSFWLELGFSCYTGGHLAQTILCAVFTMVFVVLCSLFTLVYLDSNPLSTNIAGKAHGRADFIFLLAKSALVVLAEVYPHSVGANALSGIVLATGVVLVGVYAWFMPFTHHVMNRLMLAVVMTFTWFGLCSVLTQTYPSADAGVFLYVGGPLAAFAGWCTADLRAQRLFQSEVATLWSPYEVELKVRYFLHAAIWGHPTEERLMLQRNEEEVADGTQGRRGADGCVSASAASVAAAEDVEGGDSEVRVLQVRALLQHSTLKQAESLWKAGLAHFKASALLHILVARFYSVYCNNHHLQMSHLIRAERCNPAIDVRFLIFQARKTAEDGTGSKGQMSAVNRVAFEKHLLDAKHNVRVALSRQAAFWGELANPSPDITRCHRVLADMNRAVATAERAFTQLLELNSQSLLVLRQYAEFTMYVVNNSEKANVLLAEAERLEEQQSKDHEREKGAVVRILDYSNLDVMADNTAVVIIGGSHANLGIITSVTPYASKLFGYSRWQMERRNISMLLPSPLAEAHDGYLRRYIDSGEGRVVDYTRVVFGLHRAGYIFPMLLCVREQPANDGPPAFVGIMRTLNTSENHILMTSDGVVTAASQASFTLLNVEPSALASGEAKIHDWVVEWQASIHSLSSNKGTTLCFDTMQARLRGSVRSASELVKRRETHELMTGEADSPPPSPVPTPDTASQGSVTWVRAHLQHVPLPLGQHVLVLHWTHLPTDSYTIGLAQRHRRESVEALVGASSSNLTTPDAVLPAVPTVVFPMGHPPMSQASRLAASSCPGMRVDVLSTATDTPPTADSGFPLIGLVEEHAAGSAEAGAALRISTGVHDRPAGLPADSFELLQKNPLRWSRDVSVSGGATPLAERPGATVPRSALKQFTPSVREVAGRRLPVGISKGAPSALLGEVIEVTAQGAGSGDSDNGEPAPVMFHRTTTSGTRTGRYDYRYSVSDANGTSPTNEFLGGSTPQATTPVAVASSGTSPLPRADPPSPVGAGTVVASATNEGSAAWLLPAGRGISFAPPAGASANGDRASHASSSRRSVGRRLQDRLRRSLLLGDSQSLVTGLAWLRASGLLILVVTIVLGVAMAAVVNNAYTAYSSVLDGREVATEILASGVRSTQHMRFLGICQRNWVPCPPSEQLRRRDLMITSAAEFSAKLRDLYTRARTIGYQSSFEAPDVAAATYSKDPATGALVTSSEPVSLLQAGFMLVAAIEKVATGPLDSIQRGNLDVEFMLGNAFAGGPVHDAFNATIFDWMLQIGSMNESVRSISVSVYVSMVCVVVVLGLCVVLPILFYIDRARDRYLLPFIKLPPFIPLRLRANAERRLRLLRAADADAEDGDDSGSDEERQLGLEEGDDQEGGSLAGGGEESTGTMGDETDWNLLLRAEGGRGRGSRPRKRMSSNGDASPAALAQSGGSLDGYGAEAVQPQPHRSFRKSSRTLLETITKFVLPLLLVLAFFSASFAVSTSTVSRVHVAQQFGAVAGQRALLASEVSLQVRGALATRGTREEIVPPLARVNSVLTALAYQHTLLMFVGGATEPIVADVATTNALSVLGADDAAVASEVLFGDACAVLARTGAGTLNYTACAQFRGGTMTRGMHGAFSDFLALNRALLTKRASADVPTSSVPGDGTVYIGNTTQPYSLIAELNTADLADSFTYSNELLAPCLSILADQYAAVATADIAFIQRFLVGFVTAFLLVFAAYQLLVYLPQVRRSNTEIKDERVVMLLLPATLLQSIPQLLDMVSTMVEAEEGGATQV